MRGANAMTQVESDVYNICTRVREIDPSLSVVLQEGHPKPWVVMELGIDGEERFVARYEELDARILENLRYMLAVPFEKRLDVLQRQADKENAERGRLTEEKIDQLAHAFYDAGVKSNLIDPKWGKSYRNVKGGVNGSAKRPS